MSRDLLPTLSSFMNRLSTIPERSMRRSEIRRWLRVGDADEVVAQLDEMVRRCCRSESQARTAQFAFLDYLLHSPDEDEIPLNALELAAVRGNHEAVVYLLMDPPSHRAIKESFRNNTRLRGMPLGMRKWKARRSNALDLEALMADPDPSVIRILCTNPRVREADMVAVASRRPNWPDILDEVARSKWLASRSVGQALIQNPYVRTGLALTLLPQMGPRFLARVRFATDLHPKLVEAADFYLTFDTSGQIR